MRPIARQLAGIGWTKKTIKEFLWQHARIPVADLESAGLISWMTRSGIMPPYDDPWPVTAKPENFAIIVAGGTHPTHNLWMQTSIGKKVVNAEVKLPEKWDELVARGAKELGYED